MMKKVENLKVCVMNNYWKVMLMLSLFLMPGRAFADESGAIPSEADAKWQQIIDFLVPWIGRIGGLVILIGAIEFGLAFKNDDAEAKVKGIRTIVSGCIVLAVGLSSNIFLA